MSEPSSEAGNGLRGTTKPKRSRMVIARLIIAGVTIVVVAVLAFLQAHASGGDGSAAAGSSGPMSVSSSTSGAVNSPTPTVAEVPTNAIAQPTDCAVLYTPAMLDEFGQLALNPEWSKIAGDAALFGTDDQEMQLLMDVDGPLVCLWGDERGGGDVGLTTSVVSVSSAVNTAVQARLSALKFNCYEELRGLRCVMSQSSEDGMTGESHFLRDGLWVATKWVNFAPENYTENVIANLWGDR